MQDKSNPSPLAIALVNAPALLNWYKFFKALTEQFVASDMGGQIPIAVAIHAHTIHDWEIWSILGQMIIGA